MFKNYYSHGLVVYRGEYYCNIGDDIQSLAALQFMPKVDHFIPIDEIGCFKPKSIWKRRKHSIKTIVNGWFTSNPDSWPPSPYIMPLFISFHVADVIGPGYPKPGPNVDIPAIKTLLNENSVNYYKKFEPIGCRDRTTHKRLCDLNVLAYFSGCLTLTLRKRNIRRSDAIYIVDPVCGAEPLLKNMDKVARRKVKVLTHIIPTLGFDAWSVPERFQLANDLLDTYSSASFVVTSRLHCALPCIAFGTPVLFIETQRDKNRFPGLIEMMNTVSYAELKDSDFQLPWLNPKSNPKTCNELISDLIERCHKFMDTETGFE